MSTRGTPRHNHNCRWTQATPGRAFYCAHPADLSNAPRLAPRLRGRACAARVLLEHESDQRIGMSLLFICHFLAQTPRLRGLDRHKRRLCRKAGHLTASHSYAVVQPKRNSQTRSRATHASSKPL